MPKQRQTQDGARKQPDANPDEREPQRHGDEDAQEIDSDRQRVGMPAPDTDEEADEDTADDAPAVDEGDEDEELEDEETRGDMP